MRMVLGTTLTFVVMAGAALAGDNCTQDEAKCVGACDGAKDAWCAKCKVGFFDGVKITSEKLFKALAGAEVKADAVKCPGCKTALAGNSTCSHCHVAFAGGRMYTAPVAYRIARGDLVDAKESKCSGCKAAAKDHGWCDHCNVGLVGNRMFKDKDAYAKAVEARTVVERAAKAAEKCEGCAIAMVTDGKCGSCNVAFKDGKPVQKEIP